MKLLRTLLLSIASVVCVCSAGVATTPSPPPPIQHVTDTQGVLSSAMRDSLDNELTAYEHATGHQIIVWIGDTTGDEPLEQWTVDTAQRWGIGRKGHDDGAVLFVFMGDHKLRIEVGYGLEPSLTDAQSSRIINDVIRPKMRANDYDGAIQDGVDRMLVTITPSFASQIGHAIASPEPEEQSGNGDVSLFIYLGIALIFLSGLLIVVFVRGMRYLFVLMTQGPAAAHKVWHNAWISSGTTYGSGLGWLAWSGGGGGSGFSGSSGFSGGGGGFGGGGASGGW